ncbi:MAG: TetR/AcrR family transcriptional regulator [Candidatus Promineifilaceae bacterium]|jgi:AcrR family transcriptional regulator
MARISKDPDERRSELIEGAQALFYSKGYENTSVSDIVNAVGVAKGTFYYYFDSKMAILEAMVDEIISYAVATIQEIADDDSLSASEQWARAFAVINRFKAARKNDFLELARVLYCDENTLLLQKLKERSLAMATQEFGRIVRHGVTESVFDTAYPLEAARNVLAVAYAMSEQLADPLLAPEKFADPAAHARRLVAAAQEAIERILGAAPGSLPLIDEPSIATWFGSVEEIGK